MKKDENEHLSRNTKILSISSFLVDSSSEAIFPLLPFFLTTILGAPVFVVGLMESLSESIIGIASVISGFYSDKVGKRKKIIILGYGLSASFKMLLPFLTMWQQVVPCSF
ncbi:hypothetical protein H0O02_03125 [Candidatus Micrarchaeota archaeon]|nr:hypothetical protein [Candidatus Micrarchaeota archaeon]